MKRKLIIALAVLALALTQSMPIFSLVSAIWHRLEAASLLNHPKYPPLLGKRFPEDAKPTERQKQWALATCGVLTERNGGSHDVLGASDETKDIDSFVKRDWGIRNRKNLLEVLDSLEYGGHRREYDAWVNYVKHLSPKQMDGVKRKLQEEGGSRSNRLAVVLSTRKKFKKTGLSGWDYSRYVALCGWGYALGYLSEEEAWSRIMPAARLLQKTFSSWDELADNYAEGRRFWSLSATIRGDEAICNAIHYLRWDPRSPWSRLKWNTNLLPETQKDDGTAEYRNARTWYKGFGRRDYDKAACRAEAAKLFLKAAEKGNVDAMYWLGLCYRWGHGTTTNQTESSTWFAKAAKRGDGMSQYELGNNYYWGWGVPKDTKKTFELLQQSVDNGGGPQSEAFLGWCFEKGCGTTNSMSEAMRLYRKAAEKDEAWAQNNLGDCYATGNGVETNLLTASHWYRLSATHGNKDGMYNWAECLEKGIGTETNLAEAVAWYRRSAENGYDDAKKRLDELEHKLKSAP